MSDTTVNLRQRADDLAFDHRHAGRGADCLVGEFIDDPRRAESRYAAIPAKITCEVSLDPNSFDELTFEVSHDTPIVTRLHNFNPLMHSLTIMTPPGARQSFLPHESGPDDFLMGLNHVVTDASALFAVRYIDQIHGVRLLGIVSMDKTKFDEWKAVHPPCTGGKLRSDKDALPLTIREIDSQSMSDDTPALPADFTLF